MNRIIIEYPDDCTEKDVIAYATGCFSPCQNDYKSIPVGFRQGRPLTFGDGRDAYFYKNKDGSYVLNVKPKN